MHGSFGIGVCKRILSWTDAEGGIIIYILSIPINSYCFC